MIVVDTSAFMAIVQDEPEAVAFMSRIALADRVVMSAGNYLECAMLARMRLSRPMDLDEWLARRGIAVMPVDHAQARLAAEAFVRFGKGRHPAGLNYGDCFAYALARSLDAALLFKGRDFSRTDVAPAN
ncbi:type II toxin-antitoxin system VapC family toxin [Methylobacterium nonmethylotrophicum]|uniref:Ribonuclease VapC n=1 Tax=Methylobacterium nonmethylotrophicum TaxID=1141884 RepID=A0A4Z0NLK8_9HYPH|nr:type II toxin-antitoxin system VapC family toxin [Methylobacterium nonmethylotrophicum]TGD96412.1 type II toxin-antitoxin system VapC family toxin [Methylobacterium nonmethylotrophicum]